MGKRPDLKIDQRIDNFLSYPGCDDKTLSMRKTLWGCTLIGFLYTCIVTPLTQVFQPDALGRIYYSYFMLIVLFLAVIILPNLKQFFSVYFMITTLLEILATFFVMLIYGGVSTEYSMLFACLAFILLTIPLKKLWYTTGLFCLFAVLTVVVAILGSSMKIPSANVTHSKWIDLVSVISILFMSALALFFVATFMKKQQELEQMEAIKQKELNEAKTRV